MKVKDLYSLLENMPPEMDIVILEGNKHEDNAPLMEILSAEHSATDEGDPICIITCSPNPDTIVPMQKKFESDLTITAEIMRQAAIAIQPFFPGKGFALVAFDFGDGLRDFSYISNSRRVDMIATFEQLVTRWKNQKISDN